ncbi:ATPase [Lichenihabitans psoromatis]|uniref:F0F1 ATP synthase subunit B family protein n=1 Tax=Lichenihabitans psoromatis TaxID=2528642 RepID=UPI0010385A03|nr:ATPase [Lichenihabitans psoromatis]
MTIDWWTLTFQTVNVAVLIWLLQRFFWKPVSSLIEQRRRTTQGILDDAETKQKNVTGALADIASTRAGFVKESDDIKTAAHLSAEQERAALLADAAKAAAALDVAARASIEKDRSAAATALSQRASTLAVDIAQHLASRLDGAAIQATFLEWLLKAIAAMPENERREAARDGSSLVAISAAPIAADDQERYRRLIGQSFGSHPDIVFQTDATLIVGLELRGPTLVLSNSWRADLAQVAMSLTP